MDTKRDMMFDFFGVLAAAAMFSYAFELQAQEYPDFEENGCVPPCRGGFICIEGLCKSHCNPLCPTGEICTRNGKCIPDRPESRRSPASSRALTQGGARRNTARNFRPSTSTPMDERTQVEMALGATSLQSDYQEFLRNREGGIGYARYKYEQFRSKKSAGGPLILFGILGIGAGGTMGFVWGYQSGSGDSPSSALLIAGLAADTLGVIFLIGGAVSYGKGKNGMMKLEPLVGNQSYTSGKSKLRVAFRGTSLSLSF